MQHKHTLHKRLLAILSTAALAVTALPQLPVTAADTAPPAAQSGQENQSAFTPGRDWEQYGEFVVYSENPELSADGYCGLRVTLSSPDVDLFIVSNWSGDKPLAGEKSLGTLRFADPELELYRYAPGKSPMHPDNTKAEYWCVPAGTALSSDGIWSIYLNSLFGELATWCLPVGRLENVIPFISQKLASGGETIEDLKDSMRLDVKTPVPPAPFIRRKNCDTEDRKHSWWLYQSKDEGTAWVAFNGKDGIDAEWADISTSDRNIYLYQETIRDSISDRCTYDVTYNCTVSPDGQGDAYYGTVVSLRDPELNSDNDIEVYIIDGWSGEYPNGLNHGSFLGTTTVNGRQYEIFGGTASTTLDGCDETLWLNQYWFISSENRLEAGKPCNISHPVWRFLDRLDLNDKPDSHSIYSIGALAYVISGSGAVSFTDFRVQKTEHEASEAYKQDTTGDGYYWLESYMGLGPVEFAYESDGQFSCKWEDARELCVCCGLKYPENTKIADGDPLIYSYAADYKVDTEGLIWIGVRGTFSEPHLNFYVIDGWTGDIPPALVQNGSVKCGDVTYHIYQVPDETDAFRQFWFFREDNLMGNVNYRSGTVRSNVDIAALMKAITDSGITLETIDTLTAMAAADTHSAGSVSFTKNSFSTSNDPDYIAPGKIKDMVPFTIGKQFVQSDIEADMAGKTTFLAENFDVASLETVITPTNLLSGTWQPGEPVTCKMSLGYRELEYCEAHQIPVVIGPFIGYGSITYSLPDRCYLDENGNLLSAEKMNERYDEIIKAMFELLKTEYPALKIQGVIVSTECIFVWEHAEPNKKLEQIYGTDYSNYLNAVITSTKKYCPEDCKLYIEEILPTKDEDIATFKEAAMKLKTDTSLDGVAVAISASGVDAWKEQAPFFEKTVNAFADSGLELILSDVYLGGKQAYNDTERCAAYQAAFTDFLSCSDVISMILLQDSGKWLDGPHPLSEVRGFAEAVSKAKEAAETVNQIIAPGDVNCDNAVDVSDAVLLARFVAEDTTARITDRGRANCDADGNGKVEPEDVIRILKVIAKLI